MIAMTSFLIGIVGAAMLYCSKTSSSLIYLRLCLLISAFLSLGLYPGTYASFVDGFMDLDNLTRTLLHIIGASSLVACIMTFFLGSKLLKIIGGMLLAVVTLCLVIIFYYHGRVALIVTDLFIIISHIIFFKRS